MLRSPSPPRRMPSGFTLVELLVVIAIISVLVGLTLSAVQAVRGKQEEFKVRADIEQLSQAISGFKAKFNRFPPCGGGGAPYSTATVASRNQIGTFRLCTNYLNSSGNRLREPDPTSPTMDREWPEIAILMSLFGRMDLADNGLRLAGNPVPNTTPILLDPNQCMVFFLSGGSFTDYLGFSTNPTRPFAPPATVGEQRLAGTPFFDGFGKQRDRMKPPAEWISARASQFDSLPVPPSPTITSGGPVRWEGAAPLNDTISTVSNEPWFLDPWGTPYLYLATSGVGSGGDYPTGPVLIGPWGGKLSGYNRPAANQIPNPAAFAAFPAIGMSAFKDTTIRFSNHTTFQIISGGPNGNKVSDTRTWGFGRNPTGVATFGFDDYEPSKGAGADDYGNFRDKVFGARD
ncbi:MAG: type II secretion system protein [Gemmataceae bacterium]|nr:type II secretion system protein [Gemmataceae bacterium]